ncbi:MULTISPECIES: putative porin [Shewanella]|uniref:Porin n=1 Tax=Shewanella metallivivens TaxID=2872342 RepID=A0ABT5TQJ3_9GAMM|nr:putative porin [Shewanella metallivivens]MDD8060890.1 putative porin [Shewanella metallivivens]
MTRVITTTKAITMTTVSIALTLALSTSSVYAAQDNAYHHEAEIGFLDSSGESDGLVNANYRYYFEAVEQADKPYALAAFFNQGSTVSARYATTDIEDLYNISGEYVFDSKWFLGAGVSQLDIDDAAFDITTYEISAGYFFSTNSKLTLNYATNSESTSNNDSNQVHEFESYISQDFDVITLTYEHFIPLQSTAGVFISGAVGYQNQQYINNAVLTKIDGATPTVVEDSALNIENDIYTVAVFADWYINNAWSVGATYYRADVNTDFRSSNIDYSDKSSHSDNITETGVNTRYFWHFSDVFSAKFSLEHYFDNGEYYSDSETNIGIAINARF